MLRKSTQTRAKSSQRRISVRRRLLMEKLGDRRVLASLTGIVFDDANESFQQDPGEVGLESRLVYLDHNNNGTIDAGEPYQLTDAAGGFAFTDLVDQLAIVRVFDGSTTQRQTFPVRATVETPLVDLPGTKSAIVDSSGTVAVTTDSVFSANLETGTTSGVENIGSLTSAHRLADGRLLTLGTSTTGDTAWIVDLQQTSSTAIDLSGNSSGTAWSSLAIGSDGKGVLLESSATPSAVRSINIKDPDNIIAVETATTVAGNSTAISAANSNRSVIASPDAEGLVLILWSNSGTQISPNPIVVSGISELLAFADTPTSGLLAARTIDGGVSVLDVNKNFAELQRINDVPGPVAIDAERELLFSISPTDGSLVLMSLLESEVIAQFPLSLTELGSVTAIELGPSKDSVVLVGSEGLQKIHLRQPIAHRVNVVNGEDPDVIKFGFVALRDNTAPSYSQLPDLKTLEDIAIAAAAPKALEITVDAQGDTFVLLQQGGAQHGQVTVGLNGSFQYKPDDDFFGTDTVTVLLHDGRTVSEPIVLEITVTPVPDAPTGVSIIFDPIPENAQINDPLAVIFVNDPDLVDNHLITIDDPRLGIIGNQIVLINGKLDFETEPTIPIKLTVTDPETGTVIVKNTTLVIKDENDPITGIVPDTASVFENVAGELIIELIVLDQDAEQSHTLTVDDDRFVIDFFDLRLADGVSLDFEAGEIIVVNVTATELGTGGTFTQAITIRVKDIPEQPQKLSLSATSVDEQTPGDDVGDVLIDGRIADSRYALSVDDPRFEIDGTLLKLVDSASVDVATQSEIQLQITATDKQGQFASITESFVITVIKQNIPFHNDEFPEDVNNSGDVTAADALEIVYYLNVYGPGPVGFGDPGFGYDVNGDGSVTALDALIVINKLNQIELGNNGGSEQEPEQQFAITPPAASPAASGQKEVVQDQAIAQFGQVQRLGGPSISNPSVRSSNPITSNSNLRDDASVIAAVDEFVRLLGNS